MSWQETAVQCVSRVCQAYEAHVAEERLQDWLCWSAFVGAVSMIAGAAVLFYWLDSRRYGR